ncbi:MAG: restriction endonuclease subunit S [Candidatus Gastranaerophilales bacterium]|nr:restriction endonuclease subunit S [Candidatus Gastranaerophilales bacterium]
MREYESYILSPVPWIEKMPSHWRLVRGKNLYQKMQRPTSDTDEIVTCFRDGTVTLRKKRRITGFTESLKEIGYQGIKKGDLVIHVMDAFAGSTGVSDSDGKGTPVYSVCQAKGDSNNQYYALLLREMARTGFIQSLYRGIRERSSDFRFEVFAAQFYPVPPRPEQDQIVRFLDWKVSVINRLINIRKKQIGKLYELKNSLVHQVITKGLDTESNTIASGYEWVGSIPHHWKVVSLRRVYSVILGKMLSSNPSNENCSYEEYICAKDVHFDDVDLSNLKRMWFSESEKEQYQVQLDDLLVVEGGAGAGNAAIVQNLQDRQIYVQNSIHIIRPKDTQALNSFLCYWIQSLVARGYMKNICSVATIPHFTKDKVLSTMMPLPPIREQEKIVTFLNNQFAKIAKVIDLKNMQIRQLEEYKARLISDVVTGKVDVRNIEIQEYEYVSEDMDIEIAKQEDSFYE